MCQTHLFYMLVFETNLFHNEDGTSPDLDKEMRERNKKQTFENAQAKGVTPLRQQGGKIKGNQRS